VGAGGGLHFTCSTTEGAVLCLPDGGCREDLRDTGSFLEQALKHGLRWYEYTNTTRKRLAHNGSLYLITGCDMATSWGIASFSNSAGEDEISLKFTASQMASGSASYVYKWETSSPATVRIGPPTHDWETLQVRDQPDQEDNEVGSVSGVLGWVSCF
jgi:hypothetical protein